MLDVRQRRICLRHDEKQEKRKLTTPAKQHVGQGVRSIKTQDFDSLREILKPYPDDKMTAYTVSYEVNNPRNDNPELIRKVN